MEQKQTNAESSAIEGEPIEVQTLGSVSASDLELLKERLVMYEFAARRFEDLFHGLPVACYTYDAEGCIHDWNDAARELWGFEGFQIVQRSVYGTIFPEEERDLRQSVTELVMKGKRVDNLEARTTTATGETRWTITCELPQYSADGQVVGGMSAHVDITGRKLAESALASSEHLLSTAFDVLQNGVLIIDSECRIEVCNPSACEILEVDESEFVGKLLSIDLFHPLFEDGTPMTNEDLPSVRAVRHGEYCRDVVMRLSRCDGSETIYINVKTSPIFQQGSLKPTGAITCFSDITRQLAHVQTMEQNLQQINDLNVTMEMQQMDLEDANQKLEGLAKIDGLTSVANHRTFQDFLERQMEISRKTGRELSLLMLDVDDFKSFNDDYGHQAGDEVLVEVASIMASAVRDTDLTARYGGEEFIVVLPGAPAESAKRVADAIRKNIASHRWQHLAVTVSVGVATLAGRDISKDEMIEEADKAMYASKNAGRNRSTHFDKLPNDVAKSA